MVGTSEKNNLFPQYPQVVKFKVDLNLSYGSKNIL